MGKKKKPPKIEGPKKGEAKCGNCRHYKGNHDEHGVGCAYHGHLVAITWGCEDFEQTSGNDIDYP